MLRRLPISLKIDDEDGDLYYGLIEPKKNNRELSTLVLNLLKLYHTNDIVRKEADDFMTQKSPYIKIHEELQRIALEHSRQTTSTSMLGDYADNEIKRTQEEEQPKYDEPQKSEEGPAMLAAVVEQITPSLNQLIVETINKAMQGVVQQGSSVISTTEQDKILNVEPNISSIPDVEQGLQNKASISEVSVVENTKPQFEEPINKPIFEEPINKPIFLEDTVQVESQIENQVEAPTGIPKSFMKMINSVK